MQLDHFQSREQKGDVLETLTQLRILMGMTESKHERRAYTEILREHGCYTGDLPL